MVGYTGWGSVDVDGSAQRETLITVPLESDVREDLSRCG